MSLAKLRSLATPDSSVTRRSPADRPAHCREGFHPEPALPGFRAACSRGPRRDETRCRPCQAPREVFPPLRRRMRQRTNGTARQAAPLGLPTTDLEYPGAATSSIFPLWSCHFPIVRKLSKPFPLRRVVASGNVIARATLSFRRSLESGRMRQRGCQRPDCRHLPPR